MVDFIGSSPLPCVLNNQPFKTAKTYPVYRADLPAGQSEVLHEVHCCSPDEAVKVVDSAHAAFAKWKATPVGARRDILNKAAQLLSERIPQYVALTVQETCIPKGMAGFELAVLAIAHLKEAAALMSTALQATVLPDAGDGSRKYIFREPYGVVLGITPWNAPVVLALRSVLWAIAAGNTAVMKTSEFSPRCGLMVAQTLIDAGLPEGVLSIIHVDPKDAPEVTEAIIAHPAVRKVNFTGSTRVGRIIAQTAAKHIKPVVLELGGKAPMLVLDDADLDLVANHILFGGFLNTNQICMSVNNILVPRHLEAQLQRKVAKLMADNKEIFTAKPEQNLQSPHALRNLFNPASGERLKGLYDDAISHGAKVVAGQPAFDGALVQPVVLGEVDTSMRIFREETFGPVLSMIPYDSLDDALALANGTDMGLAAAVYGKDQARAFDVAKQIDAGQVHVNQHSVHDSPDMPHGGWKESGYGRLGGGVDGLREFTQIKGITVQAGQPLPFGMM
ncbi:uncharacterized protein PFL1_02428 [Pseudozyma flocculosa PF-1]|uniref:Related to aldehyde dehydrogenase n=1 Tax=Pseudozyma flocculosa TaxID=84751 RepID=A0A5C3F7P4_9BASI|nr:uncharacterized protein PFL1_02428 [Pseudozyma flocculosa PF-1]EPQ30313.1 hypothetical protein PFL1_02428 [Pseudozyma flocculosa PF-1]SPO39745.1 related to aldehyde dehydrogenase [Pseudozyma flocculosa]